MRNLCQHCGKKEANFYYKSVVNGEVNEVQLCSDCARELGYSDALQNSCLNSHFFDLLQPDFNFAFAPLLGQWSRPLPGLLQPEQNASGTAVTEKTEQVQPLQSNKWQVQRERNALQAQLRQAIEAEDFERAAVLRDEIRKKEEQ